MPARPENCFLYHIPHFVVRGPTIYCRVENDGKFSALYVNMIGP